MHMTGKLDKIGRIIAGIIIVALWVSALIWCTACNVTRVTTTESVCVHRGDSSTTITTRTIEAYDASKK